ncbi:RTA1 like protein [Zopfia rhizophila CBS 207.26]|uniref:RTA1 like protein n=1 Tax=Zopfia rhizophila CBS 207.26 TaxID=1314779 RepID=A0A6A6ETQ6_9PEZI|nr:RTA1 like protein [Zopfia rhizophila CBS 207.26]
MADQQPVEFKLWLYTPSLAGGIIGALVFALLTGLHTFNLVRNRTWFCIPFVIGGLFETIGYAARGAAANNMESKMPYIIQSILILLAPILFAASICMILGRLILRTNSGSLSIIRPQWVTRIFVAGDVLCFLMQSTGGGLLAKAKKQDDVDMGEHIILGGLVLQILMFGFFVVVAFKWHWRVDAKPTPEAKSGEVPWKKYIYLLYAASFCITIRNLCRCVEYGMGRDAYLLTHEWTLYVYDFTLMAITLLICLQWYDPNIKPRTKSTNVEIGPWS